MDTGRLAMISPPRESAERGRVTVFICGHREFVGRPLFAITSLIWVKALSLPSE